MKQAFQPFYEFVVDIDEPADTFLNLKGLGQGAAFLNGENLGRFWGTGADALFVYPSTARSEKAGIRSSSLKRKAKSERRPWTIRR